MVAILSRPQYVNSLGPSDAIWCWRSWSTLVQVMACCLTAPSHYLNQCWLIISKVRWHSSKGKFIRQEIPQPSITEIIWKIKYLKFHSNFPGANELPNKAFTISYPSVCFFFTTQRYPCKPCLEEFQYMPDHYNYACRKKPTYFLYFQMHLLEIKLWYFTKYPPSLGPNSI